MEAANEELEAANEELKDKLHRALTKMVCHKNEAREANSKVVKACKAAHDLKVENNRLRAELAQLAERVAGVSLPSSG